MTVLALMLALLVFVPEVALAGAWASPAATGNATDFVGGVVIAPAELVPPSIEPPPVAHQVVLLFVVAIWCSLHWAGAGVSLGGLLEPVKPPGRRGRAILHAYLN
jgi:hypothetical protein